MMQIRIKARAQKRRTPGSMTATEQRYAGELQARLMLGEIQRWDFEPERLILGKDCTYQPDFRVISQEGFVEFHEVKPSAWKFIPNQSNSATKLKVAAELHPYTFCRAVERSKKEGGGFVVATVEPR